MTICISTSADGRIAVQSPYHPEFPAAARNLGGKWDARSKTWCFDARDESRVRELCCSIFGTDGRADTKLVTLRVTVSAPWFTYTGSLFLAGRQIARAIGRDSGARLGEGVVILSGKGAGSGGSRNRTTIMRAETIFELRDVPHAAALDAVENHDSALTIEIIESATA
jgi:hypothetical protein